MPFCINCGQQLPDGAKFCSECGTPVMKSAQSINPLRKQEYDGEIRKCPNCGEILNAFEAKCPACGYELRGVKSSSAVQEFSRQLDFITAEDTTTWTKPGFLGRRNMSPNEIKAEQKKRTERKIAYIQSFPIPNTKEEIFEFMILAASNMDADENEFTSAWTAKFEQAYQKAKFVFGKSPEFNKVQELYNEKKKYLQKEKKRMQRTRQDAQSDKYVVILALGMMLILAILGAVLTIFD